MTEGAIGPCRWSYSSIFHKYRGLKISSIMVNITLLRYCASLLHSSPFPSSWLSPPSQNKHHTATLIQQLRHHPSISDRPNHKNPYRSPFPCLGYSPESSPYFEVPQHFTSAFKILKVTAMKNAVEVAIKGPRLRRSIDFSSLEAIPCVDSFPASYPNFLFIFSWYESVHSELPTQTDFPFHSKG